MQGHLDMVCEKAPECTLDMEKEGLELAVDGDQVYAKGTTLGGDDGIAVAMALAVLESDGICHPRLEAVFTVDEEIGMLGAAALDVSPLKGRKLINIDSEVPPDAFSSYPLMTFLHSMINPVASAVHLQSDSEYFYSQNHSPVPFPLLLSAYSFR